MAKAASPVLGPAGWVSEPNGILTRMFTTFIANDYSQSNIYQGSVISLPWILNNNQDDNVAITELTQKQLKRWLDSHAPDNDLQVRVVNNSDNSTATLVINATITKGGRKYSAGRAIRYNTDSLVIEYVNELSS